MAEQTSSTNKPEQTKVTTTGNTIRIEPPKSRRHRRTKSKVSIIVSPDIMVGGFINFLREHAIVGLAVGFVIGTQVQTVVKQLTTSFLVPIFQLLFGTNLIKDSITWHLHGRRASIGWGAIVYELINFIFILFAIYIIIKIFKLDKLDKPAA